MEVKWLIYKISFPNGKNYIGLTKDLYNRISCHKRDVEKKVHRPLYNAINHFGWDNIHFETIHGNIPSLDEANELEKKYIIQYNSYIKNKNGYNSTEGGDGSEGRKLTPEEVEAFREWSRQLWKNPEHRAKMAEVVKNTIYDSETRSKMSESAKIRIARDGHSWVGRNHREESKDKMRKPKNVSAQSYYGKIIRYGKRVYCSDMDFVFFSVQFCAKHHNTQISSISGSIKSKSLNKTKYKSLSFYDTKE